jgi:hypothetical protein
LRREEKGRIHHRGTEEDEEAQREEFFSFLREQKIKE